MTAYELARIADVQSPDDAFESPGAQFLLGIAEDVKDRRGYGELDEDSAHEIADSAVPVYTYKMWQTFVDLCAWDEDLDDLGGSTGDMTKDAMAALYLIASRLAYALIEEGTDDDEEEDEKEDEEE